MFANPDLVTIKCMQLSGSVQGVLTLSSLWCADLAAVSSEVVRGLVLKITGHVRKLAQQVCMFLKVGGHVWKLFLIDNTI